jgi:hypothetical protein
LSKAVELKEYNYPKCKDQFGKYHAISLGGRTLEISGNAEAEGSACRSLFVLSTPHHSNGLELFMVQTNLS